MLIIRSLIKKPSFLKEGFFILLLLTFCSCTKYHTKAPNTENSTQFEIILKKTKTTPALNAKVAIHPKSDSEKLAQSIASSFYKAFENCNQLGEFFTKLPKDDALLLEFQIEQGRIFRPRSSENIDEKSKICFLKILRETDYPKTPALLSAYISVEKQ